MDYGLQISASGAMTAMYRQDVLTNNLANASTVGFKPDVPSTYQRDPVRLGALRAGRVLQPGGPVFGQVLTLPEFERAVHEDARSLR